MTKPVDAPEAFVVVDEHRPPPIPPAARMRGRLKRAWPLVVWVLAAAAAAWLYLGEGGGGHALGYGEIVQLRVIPSVSGRIAQVNVEAGQQVSVGDVVATLDAAELEDRLTLARAEENRLKCLLETRRESLRLERIDRQNQAAARLVAYEADLQRLDLEIEKLAREQGLEEKEVEILSGEIARLDPLVEKRLVTRERRDEFLLRRGVLEKGISSRAETLARARDRRKAWESFKPQPVPETDAGIHLLPYEQELAIQKVKIAELERDRLKYTLMAPTAGAVESVACRPGEWVAAGGEVAVLVLPRPGRMTAYVTDAKAGDVAPGMSARMRARDRRGASVEGKVVAVGPRMEPMPVRLTSVPTLAQWGRLVTIQMDPGNEPLPGSLYDVRFGP